MIIQRLNEYAEREGLLALDFSMGPTMVQWLAIVDAAGDLRGIIPLEGDEKRQAADKRSTRTARRGVFRTAPKKIGPVSGSEAVPTFLCDNLDRYLLWDWFPDAETVGDEMQGWVERALKSKKSRDKLRRDHRYLVDLHKQAAQECQDRGLVAVARFMERLSEPSVIERIVDDLFKNNARPWSDKLVFSLYEDQARLVHERPSVQEYWRQKYVEETKGDRSDQDTVCLCCGNVTKASRLHDKIKGIPGGQPTGTTLVSFNSPAFESYGFGQSFNSSVCEKCMVGYTRAVNHLLSDERTRYLLGPTSVATFWSVGEADINPLDLLIQADPQAVKDLLSSVHAGERASVRHLRYAKAEQFHTLVLGSNNARAVVQDYLELPLARVRENLAAWFEDLSVYDSAETRYPGLWQLMTGLAPTVSANSGRRLRDRWEEHLSPQVGPKLLRSAMNHVLLEFDLFSLAVRSSHSDPPDAPRSQRHSARVSLLKLYFNRTSPQRGETPMTPGLDRQRTEPAYRCGRLLSKLDEIQDAAIPGVKSGAVERTYGTASTAPALVFPRLLRTARHHLAKLERDKPGYKVRLEQGLQEIIEELPEFPRTLDLRNQGIFSLGFYHQQAERYRGKSQDEAAEE